MFRRSPAVPAALIALAAACSEQPPPTVPPDPSLAIAATAASAAQLRSDLDELLTEPARGAVKAQLDVLEADLAARRQSAYLNALILTSIPLTQRDVGSIAEEKLPLLLDVLCQISTLYGPPLVALGSPAIDLCALELEAFKRSTTRVVFNSVDNTLTTPEGTFGALVRKNSLFADLGGDPLAGAVVTVLDLGRLGPRACPFDTRAHCYGPRFRLVTQPRQLTYNATIAACGDPAGSALTAPPTAAVESRLVGFAYSAATGNVKLYPRDERTDLGDAAGSLGAMRCAAPGGADGPPWLVSFDGGGSRLAGGLELGMIDPVIEYDFESPVGSEWSSTATSVTPLGGRKFLGEFGNTEVRLTLDRLPPHDVVEVTFDVYAIRTWDGNRNPDAVTGRGDEGIIASDLFGLSIDGVAAFSTTFALHPARPWQSYPGQHPMMNVVTDCNGPALPAGPPATGSCYRRAAGASGPVGSLGYTWEGIPMDAVFRIARTVRHAGATLTLGFRGQNLQQMPGDESWGIDNVRIRLFVPQPAYSVLEQIGKLIAYVRGVLPHSQYEMHLLDILRKARAEAQSPSEACSTLDLFIADVGANVPGQMTGGQAKRMIEDARRVREALACGPSVLTGRLAGVVSNAATGAGIAGAMVIVAGGPVPGFSRAVTADASGRYDVGGLTLGTYDVTAAASGFATAAQRGVLLSGSSSEVNLALQPDAASALLVRPTGSGLASTSGLSMQDNTAMQLEVASATAVVWWIDEPTGWKAALSEAGLLTVVHGNDDRTAANEALITATSPAGTGAMRVNSFRFDHVPRTLTLVWRPVPGAAKYEVPIEYCHGTYRDPASDGTGLSPADCSKWARQENRVATGTRYTFDFLAPRAGRWRVVARDAAGVVISTSEYVYFNFVR